MTDLSARTPAHDTTLADLAASGFLARYRGDTRSMYAADLRYFFEWCAREGAGPLAVKRYHLEEFRAYLEDERGNSPRSVRRRLQTLRTFFKLAVVDDYVDRDPTVMLRIPKHQAAKVPSWLDRFQVGKLLRTAAAESPAHHALVALMCMLGLRVSEACAVQIEDFAEDPMGYRVLRLIGKGGKPAAMPVPVPLLRILDGARGDRAEGPLILRRDGRQQDRNGAYAWVKILCRKAGLPDNIHPHSLRHSAVTAVIDAGADLREAQLFARHADPGMTVHYFRRNDNLDAHPAHIAARVFASAT